MNDDVTPTTDTTAATGNTPTDPGAPVGSAPEPTTPLSRGARKAQDPLRGSRTSGIWAAVVSLGVLLLLLIVFIAQNTQPVSVSFLGWNGEAPLSVTVLIATAAGLFVATAAGSLRILQLRRRVHRDRKS